MDVSLELSFNDDGRCTCHLRGLRPLNRKPLFQLQPGNVQYILCTSFLFSSFSFPSYISLRLCPVVPRLIELLSFSLAFHSNVGLDFQSFFLITFSVSSMSVSLFPRPFSPPLSYYCLRSCPFPTLLLLQFVRRQLLQICC